MQTLANTQVVTMPRLISIKQVMECTALSRASIYRLIDQSSSFYDPTFPKKVQITPNRVVWVASEISDWINNKIAQRS